MLVDHAPGGCFERAGQRRRSLRHVAVNERLKLGRLIPNDERGHQVEQLRLAFVEVARDFDQDFQVLSLLANRGSRRVLARGSQIRAVAGTLDLHQSLGAATDGADLLAESWT